MFDTCLKTVIILSVLLVSGAEIVHLLVARFCYESCPVSHFIISVFSTLFLRFRMPVLFIKSVYTCLQLAGNSKIFFKDQKFVKDQCFPLCVVKPNRRPKSSLSSWKCLTYWNVLHVKEHFQLKDCALTYSVFLGIKINEMQWADHIRRFIFKYSACGKKAT